MLSAILSFMSCQCHSSAVRNFKQIYLALLAPYYTTNLSGFPFDRSCNRDESLRSTLDDIAKRHPELAEHLDTFAHRGGSPRAQRAQVDPEFDGRFDDDDFGETFGSGFPFAAAGRERLHPEEFVQRFYEPRRGSGGSQGSSRQEHAPPPENTAPEGGDRPDGVAENAAPKARSSTIQQSNTTDLGQRQEAVDDRNHRSMSAPPTDKGQRYTSSINIPVNQPSAAATAADMADPEHHPAAPHQEAARPVERIIPIQIEGRDEPVVPRKTAPASAAFAQPPPRAERLFGQRPEQFTQYLNRDPRPPFSDSWRGGFPPEEPPARRQQQQQQAAAAPSAAQAHRGPSPAGAAEQPKPAPPPPENKTAAAIEQIQVIQKDVSALMEQAQKFDGKPRDKQYLYLDEMLTRNLIKLDNIDTQGQDIIRSSRKEAIKCIEKAIGILETKAALNVEGALPPPGKEDVAEEEPAAGLEAVAESAEATTTSTDFVLVEKEQPKPAEEKEEDNSKRFELVDAKVDGEGSHEADAGIKEEAETKEAGEKNV